MYRSSLMSASSVFDLDQCLLLVMSAFSPVNRRAGVLKGGRDYAKRQQRRQPDRQLVGRNELDDGSGSDRTGPCVAIRPVTRTRHFVVRQRGNLRDALLNSRDPLLPIRIGEKHRCTCLQTASGPARSWRSPPGYDVRSTFATAATLSAILS